MIGAAWSLPAADESTSCSHLFVDNCTMQGHRVMNIVTHSVYRWGKEQARDDAL